MKHHLDDAKHGTRSLDYISPLKSGLAGGIAGVAGKTTVAPLDRVKILFQTQNPTYARYIGTWAGFHGAINHIVQHEGPLALFRGHSATILRIFPYAGIRFLGYEQLKKAFGLGDESKGQGKGKNKDNTSASGPGAKAGRRFLAGSLAGMGSVVVTYPLEVLRVRLAFVTERKEGGKRSLVDVARAIYRDGTSENAVSVRLKKERSGKLANFYRGFVPTMLGMVPYAGTSFLAHDLVGDFLRRSELERWAAISTGHENEVDISKTSTTTTVTATATKRLRWWAELIAGGSAGVAAQTVSYPFEVVRRRMQVQARSVGDNSRRLRMHEVARLILSERGISGFYVGLGIGYIKIVPMFAVTFFVYGRVRGVLGV
ncbi:mitochondrial carrier domain-containing protein [Aspergillus crustosus]